MTDDDLLARADAWVRMHERHWPQYSEFVADLAAVVRALDDQLATAQTALWSIRNECEPYTYGRDGYDITLDHIHDLADAWLASVASPPATPEE